MSLAARARYTFRDYLDVEAQSGVRHEFIDGEILAMAVGTPEHAALAGAVLALLGPQVRGGSCRVYSADLQIRVLKTGLATYADATLICGPVERDPASSTHVTNPNVIFEVLSPSTEDYDRGAKREHYQQISSLGTYVLIAQDRVRVETWTRGENGTWSFQTHGFGDRVQLAPTTYELNVSELYTTAGVSTQP